MGVYQDDPKSLAGALLLPSCVLIGASNKLSQILKIFPARGTQGARVRMPGNHKYSICAASAEEMRNCFCSYYWHNRNISRGGGRLEGNKLSDFIAGAPSIGVKSKRIVVGECSL